VGDPTCLMVESGGRSVSGNYCRYCSCVRYFLNSRSWVDSTFLDGFYGKERGFVSIGSFTIGAGSTAEYTAAGVEISVRCFFLGPGEMRPYELIVDNSFLCGGT